METNSYQTDHHSLHSVIRQKNFLKCKDLIDQGLDVNGLDENGVSPLLTACEMGKYEITKYLIDHGADVNFKKANGTTPLHIASASGRLLIIDLLIRSGAHVDALASGSTSSLFVACAGGHAVIVKNLCLAGADIEVRNHRGWTALHAACQSGNPAATEVLLNYGTDVEAVTAGTNSTALHIATMNGNFEAAELLVDIGGASMDARQADNFTPLMLAANGGFLSIVQMFLKKGADPEAVGVHLRTAVHIAALSGHGLVIKELLEFGANKNSKTDNGSTALLLACNGNHQEAVEILLSKKASVYDSNSSKPSPVAIAVQKGYLSILKLFVSYLGMEYIQKKEPRPLVNIAASAGQLEILKLLVETEGIGLTSQTGDKGYIALHEASLSGRTEIVKYLLTQGMNIDCNCETGETSLHLASKSGHLEVAQCLVEYKANVNICRTTGHAAIHFAAARGDIPFVRLLLDHGANLESSAHETGTPLYLSAERGQLGMVKFLLKIGSRVDTLCTEKKRTALHVASAVGQLPVIEALLAAGADIDAKNALQQRPEDVIGSKKSLSIVERGFIESTFNRHRKNRTKQTEITPSSDKGLQGNEIIGLKHGGDGAEIWMVKEDPSKTKTSRKLQVKELNLPKKEDIGGEFVSDKDWEKEEEFEGKEKLNSQRSPSEEGPPTDRSMNNEIEKQDSKNSEEVLPSPKISSSDNRSHTIKRLISNRTLSVGQTPRKTSSLEWNRLKREPGSARADYTQHAATDSPRKHQTYISKGSLSARRASLILEDSKNKEQGEGVSIKSLSRQSTILQEGRLPKGKMKGCDSTERSVNRQTKYHCKRSSVRTTDSLGYSTKSMNSRQNSISSIPTTNELSHHHHGHHRNTLFSAANGGNIGVVDKLLASGVNPNMRAEEHGWTPLYAASRQGHIEIVQKLLDHGALVNDTINSGATCLHGAAAFGQERVAKLLIEHGARLDAVTKNGELPLHTAARNGFMHVVALLLSADKSLINRQRFNDGSTALHLACEKQWAGAVKELIDWKADAGITKQDGITPLYMTSITGNKSIAQMLLASAIPFDVDIQTVENWTALHVACARGDLDMVRLLLRAGANPSLKTNMDMSPSDLICEWVTADGGRSQRIRELIERPPTEKSYMLVDAAANGDLNHLKELLDDGADINVFGDEGLTPLLFATRNGHVSCVNLLVFRKARMNLASCPGNVAPIHYASIGKSRQLLEFLLSNGAHVNAHDETGQTPLHYACHRGGSVMVSVLLSHGADVHANDKYGKTPLFMAAASNNYEAVALLLRNQAYPSCASADGNTPLHAAAEIGGEETIHLLLRNRGDPNAKNARKETPLSVAAKHGHTQIISLLISCDIEVNALDKEGNTPLHLACMYGHLEAVEALLRSPSIETKARDKKGQQCNEVIGQLVSDKFDNTIREQITQRLLKHHHHERQYGRHEVKKNGRRDDSISQYDIESFKCPITKEIMNIPVVASDGHTYEYGAISQWIKEKGTSPMSDMKLTSTALHHNHKLKSKIEAWRDDSRLPIDH